MLEEVEKVFRKLVLKLLIFKICFPPHKLTFLLHGACIFTIIRLNSPHAASLSFIPGIGKHFSTRLGPLVARISKVLFNLVGNDTIWSNPTVEKVSVTYSLKLSKY